METTIRQYPGEFKVRGDNALTTPKELLMMLDWQFGDGCKYEVDITDPKKPRLIIVATKHLNGNSSLNGGKGE